MTGEFIITYTDGTSDRLEAPGNDSSSIFYFEKYGEEGVSVKLREK